MTVDSIQRPARRKGTVSRRELLGRTVQVGAAVSLVGTATAAAAPVVKLSLEGPELAHAPRDLHYRIGQGYGAACRRKAGVDGVAQPLHVAALREACCRQPLTPKQARESQALRQALTGPHAEAHEASFLAQLMTRLSGHYSQVEAERLSFVAGFADGWYGL